MHKHLLKKMMLDPLKVNSENNDSDMTVHDFSTKENKIDIRKTKMSKHKI